MNTLLRTVPLAAFLLLAAHSFSHAHQRNKPVGTPEALAADTTVNVDVAAMWNIIGVPLIAAEMHKDTLFPSSISNAFYFDNGYIGDNDLVMGKGYWLKFDSAETIPLFGSAVHQDTFDVVAGWNMIGSISDPVAVGAVTTIPGGITLSNFWGFENGYVHAASLTPGGGYWVKTSSAGALVLDGSAVAAPRSAVDPYSGLHTLTIEDARGMKQTLRFGETTAKLAGTVAEMPPPPPAGILDARFSDDTWAQFYAGNGEHRFGAKVTSAVYPITVRWNVAGNDRRTIVFNGTVRMSGSGSVVMAEAGPIDITAGLSGVPARFALRQNYPNPFNPTTVIAYDLPVDAAVKLAVYDLLGREVAVLVDGPEAAGVHDIVFDATGLTSGIYFYRIEAGDYSDARKLVIMK